MTAYLTQNPPAAQQWYAKRNRALTGCTVLHTAESVMDTVGPDTGAEAVAKFIQGRTTAGSYHDLVDSDSWIPLVDLKHGAFHDGTGSNNWALSISFACRTSDWRAMSPEKRRGFLRQGARAFANQQAYRRSIGAPLTELRLITKAQSDAGVSGFTYHGLRDPGRRSDPGVAAPNLFPFDEFITECRAALSTSPASTPKDWFDMVTKDEMKELLRTEVADRLIAGSPDGKQALQWWQVENEILAHLRNLTSGDPLGPGASAVIDRPIGALPGTFTLPNSDEPAPRLWQLLLDIQARLERLEAASTPPV
jgi:hypothetical protein